MVDWLCSKATPSPMRLFEALLLLSDLLTLIALAIPLPRAVRWMRHSPVIALLVAGAQGLVEGVRWEMFPAYLLTGLFFLAWMLRTRPGTSHPTKQTPSNRYFASLGIGLGIVGLAVSLASPLILPVFHFPRPSGPYSIGTVTYHWVDAQRPEIFSADPKARRELMVQVWYPAKKDPSAPHAAYLPEADAVTAAFARIHHVPRFIFDHFRYVKSNALSSAPAAGDQVSYPVLLFLEGATGYRQMNTFQVEELASHGYIVAAIDQPGAAANVVFPDKHAVLCPSLEVLRSLIHQSYGPRNPPPTLNQRTFQEGIVPYLAQDVIFSLDQLAALNQADPTRILTGKLDLRHVGTFGISLGGIVGSEACRVEPRLRACLIMDAPMPTEVVKTGLIQPCMWITRDTATMRLERRRAGGWSEADIHEHQTTMRAVFENLRGDGYFVQIPGMFHANFTDLPYWSPLLPWLGFTGPIDGKRAHSITNAYTLAFFNRHLKGLPETLLDDPTAKYHEVLFETHRP